MIRLEHITPDNWRLGLQVSESQKKFVSDDMRLLARAYAYRASRSQAFVIYDEDTPVGMALYYDCDSCNAYDFSQLFIDEKFQGKGYGEAAARKMLDMMKDIGTYDEVILCYKEGNEAAKRLYEKLGFYLTGERDEDEIIMKKVLRIRK